MLFSMTQGACQCRIMYIRLPPVTAVIYHKVTLRSENTKYITYYSSCDDIIKQLLNFTAYNRYYIDTVCSHAHWLTVSISCVTVILADFSFSLSCS